MKYINTKLLYWKFINMWNNFRILQICHVEKSEISLHVESFQISPHLSCIEI